MKPEVALGDVALYVAEPLVKLRVHRDLVLLIDDQGFPNIQNMLPQPPEEAAAYYDQG